MARLSIDDLEEPEARYAPYLAPPCPKTGNTFETRASAEQEDLTRSTLIRRTCATSHDLPFDRADALELAGRLQESGRGIREHETLASKVCMGRKRIRVVGALWRLIDAQ